MAPGERGNRSSNAKRQGASTKGRGSQGRGDSSRGNGRPGSRKRSGSSQRESGSGQGWQSYNGPRPSKPARKKGRRPGDLGGKTRSKSGRR